MKQSVTGGDGCSGGGGGQVACGGGLEDFLRKLEAAQRELQLTDLDVAGARSERERRNVVKRPGVSYERGDDDAVGLRGPGAGSDDADQESLQGFDEPSFPDNDASDEAAILRELEEINSGSDTVKRASTTSKRSKRQRSHWTDGDYGDTYKEDEKSKQFQTPSEDQYGLESMLGHDVASLDSGHPTLRMRGLNGNTTVDAPLSQSLLGGMQNTRENVPLQNGYVSPGMGSYPKNMQRSLLYTDSEMERPDSQDEIFHQKSLRKADNIPSSDTSSQIGNEDDTLHGYNFRNLENVLESDMVANNRDGVPVRRDHKTPLQQRNSFFFRQQLAKPKNGIQSGYSDKGVEDSQDGTIQKTNFGGRDTEGKKLTGEKLERWNELNNNDDDKRYSRGGRLMSHAEGKVYKKNNERRTLMEQPSESKHERGITHEQNSKYKKHTRFRYSFAPAANYESKKQRKAVTKTKEPFNREKYSMVRHQRRLKSRSSAKQKHSLRHSGGNDITGAATKEQLILEDSPGKFDLFDTGHSSKQRSSAKTPKDDESFHFLWDHQFDSNHHTESSNMTKEDHEAVHMAELLEKKELNSSSTIHVVHGSEEHASHEPREDPAMEGIHSGKTIVTVIEEVIHQVEKNKEVSKHVGTHLVRDHVAEAEVHELPEAATECAGHPCPSALLSKLTNAVAAIVNSEVSVARCEPMHHHLRCFMMWLLEGATEQFRPKNPGYVDPKRLAFYAAYYEEPGAGPPQHASAEHAHTEATEHHNEEEANPCESKAKGEGHCLTSHQENEGAEGGGGGEEDNEWGRQIRLLEKLLKEYHALSSREQTRLHTVHQYLEQQLAALEAASTPFPAAAHLAAQGAQVGAEETGMGEDLGSWHPEEGNLMESSPMESPMDSDQKSGLSHETKLEQEEQVVEQEAVPVMGEDFDAGPDDASGSIAAAIAEAAGEAAGDAEAEAIDDAVAIAASESTTHHAATSNAAHQQDVFDQNVGPVENEDQLIEKDLELLGLGNSSNFGTKFNLAPLGHQRVAEQAQEEEEEEPMMRGRMQKRDAADAHAHAPAANASDVTTKAAAAAAAIHDDKAAVSPQPQAEHSLTAPEERFVLSPLLDNADAQQRRRR